MNNYTVTVILCILALAGSISCINQANAFQQKTSLAKPNWWVKPSPSEVLKQKSGSKMSGNMTAEQVNKTRTEPLSHFLDYTKDEHWSLISNNIGMASAKYYLTFSGKKYELAIMRMNNKIPLDSLLSIWQNKVGLMLTTDHQEQTLTTKRDQKLQLLTVKGDKKAILVAYHKQQKYTFFRLLSNDGFTDEVKTYFHEFLTNVYIKN